jgi:hypothetical protein
MTGSMATVNPDLVKDQFEGSIRADGDPILTGGIS